MYKNVIYLCYFIFIQRLDEIPGFQESGLLLNIKDFWGLLLKKKVVSEADTEDQGLWVFKNFIYLFNFSFF